MHTTSTSNMNVFTGEQTQKTGREKKHSPPPIHLPRYFQCHNHYQLVLGTAALNRKKTSL